MASQTPSALVVSGSSTGGGMASHAPALEVLTCTRDNMVSVTFNPEGYSRLTNRDVMGPLLCLTVAWRRWAEQSP